jgi:hypothetical protein
VHATVDVDSSAGTVDLVHQSVKIGTWNVQYARGAERNNRRAAKLQEHDAEVWVLTETHDDLDLSATHRPIRATPRYENNPNAYWTTIWSRLPLIETIPIADPCRTVAARLELAHGQDLIVYGTVLPRNGDKGPNGTGTGWSEFMRVVPMQGREWAHLRRSNPGSMVVVAGDLNHNLGGKHYYGTVKGRALLREALAVADLVCVTDHECFPPGDLTYSPIDHVCAAPPNGSTMQSSARGWDKVVDGLPLSDHSGVVAELTLQGGVHATSTARGSTLRALDHGGRRT